MTRKKINDAKMLRMLDDGVPQTKIAKEFGVSPAAVCLRIKELRPATSFAVASTMVKEVTGRRIDVIDQLYNINRITLDVLNKASTGRKSKPELMLRAIAEVRAQVSLQADLFSKLYDMESAAKFQEAILETLAEVSPEMRKLAIKKLNEKNAMSNALRFK